MSKKKMNTKIKLNRNSFINTLEKSVEKYKRAQEAKIYGRSNT